MSQSKGIVKFLTLLASLTAEDRRKPLITSYESQFLFEMELALSTT